MLSDKQKETVVLNDADRAFLEYCRLERDAHRKHIEILESGQPDPYEQCGTGRKLTRAQRLEDSRRIVKEMEENIARLEAGNA